MEDGRRGGIDQSCSLNRWRILKATCKTWRNADRIFLGRRKQTGKSGWTEAGLSFWVSCSASLAGRESFDNEHEDSGYRQVTLLVEWRKDVDRHFCWAKPLFSFQQGSVRAKRVKSGNVCDVGGFSPIDIPNRSGIKGGKINRVRRETAVSLLYCGHECDPPFCDAWHSHQVSGCCSWGESSISLTSMGLSGGGCPFKAAALRESLCAPATGASHSQVMCLPSETDVTWREEHGLCHLHRWQHHLERPRLHFDERLHRCWVLCSYFLPVSLLGVLLIMGFSHSSQQQLHAVLNACLWSNCKESAFSFWIKLEAFLSGLFY